MNGVIAQVGSVAGTQIAGAAGPVLTVVPTHTLTFSTPPETLRDDWPPQRTLAEVIQKKSERAGRKGRVLFATEQKGTRDSSIPNGLLSAMRMAYSAHVPLKIRPDDIWLSIAAAFGIYVTEHSEEMRHLFVRHEGKKELTVQLGGTVLEGTGEGTWQHFFDSIGQKIGENVDDPKLAEWAAPDFATTTDTDRAASRVLLMGAMQKYFGYKMILACGLPSVTLVGDSSDWGKLRSRVDYLAHFPGELAQWSGMLAFVLDKLVAASEGETDENFWQRMITSTRIGSGGEEALAGWFTVFAPFDDTFRYVLTDYETASRTGVFARDYVNEDIASATVDVPVTVVEGNGTERSIHVYAGVNLPHYDNERNVLSPSVGWGVFVNK